MKLQHIILSWLSGMLLLVLSIPFSVSAQSTERILSFSSDIRIHTDRTLTVTETITVVCNQEQITRGIFRDFPTTYTDRFGNTMTVTFDVQDVLRDGDADAYHTENVSNGVRVYIGRKNVLLDPGEYTYTLTYTTDHQLGFFEDFDELYWNVTGNGWGFEIEQAQAIVELPDGAKQWRRPAKGCLHTISLWERAGDETSNGNVFHTYFYSVLRMPSRSES